MIINKKTTFKRGIVFAGVVFCLSFSLWVEAENSTEKNRRVDLVWAASDGLSYELYSSTQQEGKWSEPEKVTNDNADNLHPCLGIGADGKKWLVWTAIEQGGNEIRYAVEEVGGKWSNPQTLPSKLSSNIAPTMILDGDEPWIVWSGNDGVFNDEIYYTKLIDGKWQKPQLVNKPNEFPDILPVIAITGQGVFQVTWDGYREGSYKKLRATWSGKKWGFEELVDQEKVTMAVTDEQVGFPDFVEDAHQAFLRISFPKK